MLSNLKLLMDSEDKKERRPVLWTDLQGTCYLYKAKKAYIVYFSGTESTKQRGYFAASKYGSLEIAEKAAHAFWRQVNIDNGWLQEIRSVDFPVSTMQIIAGFYDGDGSISCCHRGYFWVRLMQSQNEGYPEILAWLKTLFPMACNEGKYDRKKANQRIQHTFNLNGKYCLPLLELLIYHAIVKQSQAALVFNTVIPSKNLNVSEVLEKLHTYNTEAHYQEITVDPAKLSWPYLAGLFMAEGSIGYYDYGIHLTIAQKVCRNLLDAIKLFFGKGNVNKQGYFVLYAVNAIEFINAMMPYLMGTKKEQCLKMIQLFELRGDPSTKEERQRLSLEIKQLKHV